LAESAAHGLATSGEDRKHALTYDWARLSRWSKEMLKGFLENDMRANSQHKSQAAWVLAALCVSAAVVLFANRALLISGMSTGFIDSTTSEWYFFPHHLFFHPTVNVFRIILAPLGCDAVCAGQAQSVLWVVVTIAAVYLLTLHLTRSLGIAVLTGLLVLVSHHVWVFATQIEPYPPLVGMNALLAAMIIINGQRPWSQALTGAVIAIFTFTLFLHQANVFFLLPLAIYMGLAQGRAGLLTVAKVTAVAGVVSLGVFILTYWLTQPEASPRGFYLWLTYYGVVSDDTHGAWEALLTLDMQRLQQAGRSIVAAIITEPSDALRKPVRIIVSLLLLVSVLWNVVYVATRRPDAHARLFLLLWAAVFLVFFTWWHASVHKFFLVSLVPMLLLVGLALADLTRALAARPFFAKAALLAAVLMIASVGYVNFDRSVRPLTGDGSGVIRISGKLAKSTPPECVLYTKRRFGGYLSNVHGMRWLDDYRNYQMMYMAYHFGKSNPDIGQALKYTTRADEDECNVIPLGWLSYDDFEWRGGLGMRRARDATAGESARPNWPEFIGWILAAQPDPAGRGILHDEFAVYRGEDEEAYVRINRGTRVHAESIDAVLDLIDVAVQDDPMREQTIREHEALNRFQQRVFGYS